ncbi:hypothetical protein CATMIT_01111 [Catenibacterium mitsuokai DSM 15897]|uniref:hypothetical protein n=1 Tax=Catenibacterium mitsuokai TaxID=100886 RepID=UPI000196BC35|nr:hypothetical protein [Catenibacterium mitsuokai]EEF94277.1 hypothetical protein CATMIT_01111 [Catenibacterium mitsuokai DSM 15897]UWO52239.1 hypothetical protein NQ499_08110 [Catenibacterium mitsuokai]
MDLVYKRYSNPMELIDNMISLSNFSEFISELADNVSEEKLYDIWKSKVYDKSFADFKNEMMAKWKKNTGIETSETMTDEEMETTINDSYEILNNFNPNL